MKTFLLTINNIFNKIIDLFVKRTCIFCAMQFTLPTSRTFDTGFKLNRKHNPVSTHKNT